MLYFKKNTFTIKKNMIYSFTGVSFSDRDCGMMTTLMVESLIQAGVDVVCISATYSSMVEFTNALKFIEGMQRYRHAFKCWCTPAPMTPYDHFKMLTSKMIEDEQPDATVLFCNYSDLVLRLPKEGGLVKGSQYVPEYTLDDNTENMSVEDVLDVEPAYKHAWSKYVDFSGYIAPITLLEKYFQVMAEPDSHEDVRLMDFLDSQGAVEPSAPFVFHRLREEPQDKKQEPTPFKYVVLVSLAAASVALELAMYSYFRNT